MAIVTRLPDVIGDTMQTEYRRLTHYHTVSHVDLNTFNAQCQAKLDDGWDLFGRLHVSPLGHKGVTVSVVYSQCFCKYGIEEAERPISKY